MDFSQWGEPSKEWLSFAAANSATLSRSDDHLPALKQQENANNGRAKVAKTLIAATGLDKLVATQDYVVPMRDGNSITVRSYRPILLGSQPLPGYVYYHGGGFIYGGVETEIFHCSWVAHALSMNVVHVVYRQTPHVKGLTIWHDGLDGFEWVATHTDTLGIDPSRLVVGGVSAGANLAASVVQNELRRARETGSASRIKGQLLCIPNVVHKEAFPYHLFADREKVSLVQCADAAVIPKHRLALYTGLLGDEVDPTDRTWSPALAEEEELRGIPPTAFLIAGWDPLRDEALWYAQKLKNAGVQTKVHIFPGLPHAFNSFRQLPSHKRWNEVLLDCLRWAAADEDSWMVELPPAMPSGIEGAAATTSSTQPATTGVTIVG
ncbi:alpha/beta-hydrolase [Hypoxylon rubiginosum]|uniref:Alpha/beta-hydrolase n=1 Tax=Hypoxylon rubiginosum TaxID=110542 RepID=A0ACB9YXJ2_9PEZI|nr:alpha/beta-hydrolase [Hypoxylon rubiginosum]